MEKIKGFNIKYMNGDLMCLKRGVMTEWYWTPEGYGTTYFLFGTEAEVDLREKTEAYLENGALEDYIMATIKREMEDSEDSDMFAEIYDRLTMEG